MAKIHRNIPVIIEIPVIEIQSEYTYTSYGQKSFPLDMLFSEIVRKVEKNKIIIYSGLERKFILPEYKGLEDQWPEMPKMPIKTNSDGKKYCEIPILDEEDFSHGVYEEGDACCNEIKHFPDCTLEDFLNTLNREQALVIRIWQEEKKPECERFSVPEYLKEE